MEIFCLGIVRTDILRRGEHATVKVTGGPALVTPQQGMQNTFSVDIFYFHVV
jgi:hypothetical protein